MAQSAKHIDGFIQVLKNIAKYSPYIVTLYVYFIMAKPDLAVLLLVDYFVIDPVFRKLLFHTPANHEVMAGNPNVTDSTKVDIDKKSKRDHSQLHWILLTYTINDYLTTHKNWLSLVSLIFTLVMTFIVMYVKWHSGKHQLNELIGEAVGGIVIGLLYLSKLPELLRLSNLSAELVETAELA